MLQKGAQASSAGDKKKEFNCYWEIAVTHGNQPKNHAAVDAL